MNYADASLSETPSEPRHTMEYIYICIAIIQERTFLHSHGQIYLHLVFAAPLYSSFAIEPGNPNLAFYTVFPLYITAQKFEAL